MTEWTVGACLGRADEFLQAWQKDAKAEALVHAALELRWALELYLLTRYEAVTGERPNAEGCEPLELLDEALLLHDEAMSPQTWGLGVMEDIKESPLRAIAQGGPVLTLRKARSFYGQLSELQHGTALYLPRAESAAFWTKQHMQLTTIHAELSDILLWRQLRA